MENSHYKNNIFGFTLFSIILKQFSVGKVKIMLGFFKFDISTTFKLDLDTTKRIDELIEL